MCECQQYNPARKHTINVIVDDCTVEFMYNVHLYASFSSSSFASFKQQQHAASWDYTNQLVVV